MAEKKEGEESSRELLKPLKKIEAKNVETPKEKKETKQFLENIKKRGPKIPGFAKLHWMIKKDIKLLIRSKTSALIVLLGPLLLILLVGFAFNTSSLYNLKIGSYSESYSELTEEVLIELGDQQYSVIKSVSPEDCMNGIKTSKYHVCAIFPKDMSLDNNVDSIIIYVDESRMNLASIVSGAISTKIANKSSAISLDLTTIIVNVLDETKKTVVNDERNLQDLETSTIDYNTKLMKINEDLAKLNLTINSSETNLSSIRKELNEVDEKNEEVSGCASMGKVKSELDKFEKGFEKLETSMNDAKLTIDTSTTDISTMRTKLTESTAKIKQTKDSLKTTRSNIESIKITNAEAIVSPIKTAIEPIVSKKTHLGVLFPTLVVLIMMFISILLASTLVVREKTSLAYFRNFITPTNDFLFMLGAFLTNIILLLVQLIILFGVAIPLFSSDLLPIMLPLSLSLIIISTLFILIGMLIGYLFNSEETSTLAAIAVATLMLFFSNTILPLETIPQYLRDIVQFNPFVMGEGVVKQIMMFGSSISDLWVSLVILVGVSVVLAILTFFARKATKRRLA
ncbi:MAG: ABC transporter permease [Candidatus Nanoarchaeia archaeon]|nr:ABC transporter permease [Candidatus Nanoarchaeia archaeon]